MVTALIFLAIAIWLLGMILMVIHVRLAPVGVEDENGFRVVPEQPADQLPRICESVDRSRAA